MANKYSSFKIFHFKEKLNSLPQENSEMQAPIHIRIKPTNVCNHNCWYCSYKADHLQLGQDMVTRDFIPEKKMMEIIDDCSDMGVKAITFSGGGEPFIYKYFTQTIKKLIETDISFASLTNGSGLHGEMANLFAYNATWVRVSIDGYDDESYSKARGVKVGEFSKIVNNMEEFIKIKNRSCNLGVSFIVDKTNYTQIYNFAVLMKKIGVESLKIAPCIVDNDGRKNNDYHGEIFNDAKELAQKAKNDLSGENFEVFDSYHSQLETFDKDYTWCPYSQINPVIGADMNIYPCHDKAYNLENGLIGSIKETSFKEFWLNNKSQFFKINPSIHCQNHCVVNEKNKMILDYLDVDHLGFV